MTGKEKEKKSKEKKRKRSSTNRFEGIQMANIYHVNYYLSLTHQDKDSESNVMTIQYAVPLKIMLDMIHIYDTLIPD